MYRYLTGKALTVESQFPFRKQKASSTAEFFIGISELLCYSEDLIQNTSMSYSDIIKTLRTLLPSWILEFEFDFDFHVRSLV